MRIGFDVSKVVPPLDGIGTYGVELLRALATLSSEHTLRLHGLIQPFDSAAAREALEGMPGHVEFADCSPKEDKLDLFHCTTLAWPEGYQGPVVFTCFDLTFVSHGECHTLLNRLHCMEGMLSAVLSQAHVVAVSEATALAAVEYFGIPRDRLTVVPCAAASATASPAPRDEASIRQRLGRVGLCGEYLLAVGTLEPRKNLVRLLDAHAALPEELRRRCPLALAGGGGWNNQTLEARLKTAEHVVHLGYVDQDLLADLYAGATAFVYPSLAEGFGLPILEAMQCGTPVITSDTTSMPEVAGGAALLVDPVDTRSITNAIERILSDADLARELGEKGLVRAAEFSWQRAAVETLELYGRATR